MPKGDVCIINPSEEYLNYIEKKLSVKLDEQHYTIHGVLHCVDTKDGREHDVTLEGAENYICHPPDHYERIIHWCKEPK